MNRLGAGKGTLDRVGGIVYSAAADADALEVALDQIITTAFDPVDPDGALT
jgi:hypothetical protein